MAPGWLSASDPCGRRAAEALDAGRRGPAVELLTSQPCGRWLLQERVLWCPGWLSLSLVGLDVSCLTMLYDVICILIILFTFFYARVQYVGTWHSFAMHIHHLVYINIYTSTVYMYHHAPYIIRALSTFVCQLTRFQMHWESSIAKSGQRNCFLDAASIFQEALLPFQIRIWNGTLHGVAAPCPQVAEPE